MTGLATGVASGAPVYEAAATPGGICSSYYVRPGTQERLAQQPSDGNAYRFELGGGHWIFGGNPSVLRYIQDATPVRRYARKSSIWFPSENNLAVPYPIQNHLRGLGAELATKALAEMARPTRPAATMKGWLDQSFGPTLCEKFFYPFHALYTAGLYDRIAPQDAYKSPVDLNLAIRGALSDTPAVGYNTDFAYPEAGLDALSRHLAARADMRFGHRAVRIDPVGRTVEFENGSRQAYDRLISTLPLDTMLALTGLDAGTADPHTAVLVLNIGARRGRRCPDDHWLYFGATASGFHRVGFYDNVDPSFLPASVRDRRDRTSIYVERAYPAHQPPSASEIASYQAAVARELQQWEVIEDVEVSDPTWIEVAYTWSWPGSSWPRKAAALLESHEIHSIGRYGRWSFQGIAESLHEGFAVGGMLRQA